MKLIYDTSNISEGKLKILRELEKAGNDILNTTITEFAKKINTSPSQIVKTLKHIQYKGWKDFLAFISIRTVVPDARNNYSRFLEYNFSRSLNAALSGKALNMLKEFGQSISKSKKIFFISSYTYKYVCMEFVDRFSKLGIFSENILDNENNITKVQENSSVVIVGDGIKDVQKHINFFKRNSCNVLVVNFETFNEYYRCSVIQVQYSEDREINERIFPRTNRLLVSAIIDYVFISFFNLQDKSTMDRYHFLIKNLKNNYK